MTSGSPASAGEFVWKLSSLYREAKTQRVPKMCHMAFRRELDIWRWFWVQFQHSETLSSTLFLKYLILIYGHCTVELCSRLMFLTRGMHFYSTTHCVKSNFYVQILNTGETLLQMFLKSEFMLIVQNSNCENRLKGQKMMYWHSVSIVLVDIYIKKTFFQLSPHL